MLLKADKIKTRIFISVMSLLLLLTSCAPAPDISIQKGPVNDYAKVLNKRISSEVTVFAKEIEHKAGVELVVLTMRAVVSPESFSKEIFKKWNIGGKEDGQKGILILLDVENKTAYIENTPSLDNIITKDKKKVILTMLMKKSLKKSNFDIAMGICVVQLAKVLRDGLDVDIRPVYNDLK